MADEKKKILIVNKYYLPGFRSGGPVQSISGLIERLSEKYAFSVLCRDRDEGNAVPYDGIKANAFNQMDDTPIYYASPSYSRCKVFANVIYESHCDIVWLNSVFSTFTINVLIAKRMNLLPSNVKIILAPRGDFTGGLIYHRYRKLLYLCLSKWVGMYREVYWHSTCEMERQDIYRIIGANEKVFLADNYPPHISPPKNRRQKERGKLRLCFVSRIVPKKNLIYALQVLKEVKDVNIVFDIYGTLQDEAYWKQCQKAINELPSNISAGYFGVVERKDIEDVYADYEAFFFPTWGENYGYVIVEAMKSGCLCILSKHTTPWDDYDYVAESVCSLSEPVDFCGCLQRLAMANEEEFRAYRKRHKNYIDNHFDEAAITSQYHLMLEECLS